MSQQLQNIQEESCFGHVCDLPAAIHPLASTQGTCDVNLTELKYLALGYLASVHRLGGPVGPSVQMKIMHKNPDLFQRVEAQ